MRKRDSTRRCFICIELGNIAKNYMNTRRIEDEKKAKAENIRKQMRQQWIPKSSEDRISRNEDIIPSNSDDTNEAIKELLEKNDTLQEEVRKLRREKEIQSIRLCEVMEEKNKIKEEIE